MGPAREQQQTNNNSGGHGLDTLFQAHLPEFLQALSAGLSPIKQHKKFALEGTTEHAAQHNNSPTASGVSSTMQRSFSAVELHAAGAVLLGQQLPPLLQHQQQHHKRTASTDAMASCWTDGCSSNTNSHSSYSSVGDASPEVKSGAAAARTCVSGWPLTRSGHGGSMSAVEAAAGAEQAPGMQQQKKLPPCPVLWRPTPSLVVGLPVGEGVEEAVPSNTAQPDGAGMYAVQQQQHQPSPSNDSAPQRAPEQRQQQQQQQHAVSVPTSPAGRLSRDNSSWLRRSSSISNLMQALHGLLGSSSSRGKLQVQVPAEGENVDGLDVREYINYYSPDAVTRQSSRAGSSAAPDLPTCSAIRERGSGSSRASPAASPRASGSFPDLRLFWGSYSQAGSKAPSRRPSGVGTATEQLQQTGHVQLQHSEPQHPQELPQQPGQLATSATAAAAGPVAAADTAAGAAGADLQGGGVSRVLPLSPSPSKRSILLHGPSRLSLRTSVSDAASVAAHQDSTPSVEQQLVVAAAAATPPQAHQPGPLQQHAKLLWGLSETLGAAVSPGPPVAAAAQPAVAEMPAPPAGQQQQVVSRQLFSAPQEAAQLQAPAPAAQQQDPQAGQVGNQAKPVASPSPSKKQSMLWSLMHKKGSSSSRVLTPAPADAVAAPGADAAGDRTATVSAPASVSTESGRAHASVPSSSADSLIGAQQLQASVQHDRAPAAGAAASVQQAAAAAAAPAAAGPGLSAGAADVVAASMERIASCLEEYLCDNTSPSVSPTRGRGSSAQRQHSSTPRAAAAEAGAACSSSGQVSGRDQGEEVNVNLAAGDAAQHAAPKKAAAGHPQGVVPVWSPAAAAAKARMMAPHSPSKLQQVEATPRPTAGGRDTGPGEQLPRGDQDSRGEAAGAAVGWVHPGDLRLAAAAGAHAAGRLQSQQPQLHSLTALQDRVASPGQPLAHLPRGLRPPPGLGLSSEHQQQQEQQEEEVHLDPQAVPSSRALGVEGEAAGATDGDGQQQLASLFALACRAAGIDVLQQGSPQAAAPAVTAAALTAAMAAAVTAYQQQQQAAGSARQQPDQWCPALPYTTVAGRTAASHPMMGARMRHTQGLGAQLWRPEGCGGSGSSSGAWADTNWHQDVLHTGPLRSPRRQVHHSGQPVGGVGLWRQQQQQPVSATGQQPKGRSCSPAIRTLQPERASHLRLLRPGQLPPTQPQVAGQPSSSDLSRPYQQHQQQQVPGACSTHYLQGWPEPHRLVRLPVQQQPAAPLQPRVLLCASQALAGAPAAAPWQHPSLDSMQGVVGAAAVSATGVGGSRLPQQPAPWQSEGWAGPRATSVSAQQAGGDAAGREADGSRLAAGAAAARLLQGLLDPRPEQTRRQQEGSTSWPAGLSGRAPAGDSAGGGGADLQQTRQQLDAQPTGGMSEQSCPARQPGRLVVIDAQPPCEQQQQQQAPWQQQGPQIDSIQPCQHSAQKQQQQQQQDQQQPEAAPAQLPAQLQQQQQWQVTLPAPHSPVKSPRKHPAGRRWALLQKLKAINRGNATAAALRPDRPDAAVQLVAQLQQLMQGPLGAAQGPAGATTSSNDGWKPDLDAAAAMALHHVAPAQQQGPSRSSDQQQQEGGDGTAPCCSQQDPDPLCTQASLHSAAAQTSEMLLHVPDAVAAAVTDAAVQAASATADAGTGSEQQQDTREQGALELAQLILNAFDRSGGVIWPEAGQGCGHLADTMQPLQQGAASWGLLPNPFAGAAAPLFQSVEDLPQRSPPGVEPSQSSSGLGDDGNGQEGSMQQCGLLYKQGQESSQQQQLGGGGGKGTTQHGCCFAACPRHISSPELGASTQPQQQRVARRTTGAKQPAKAAAGRGSSGAPSLARSSRANGSSSTTRRPSTQQAGAPGPQGDATYSQPRQQQQQGRTSSSSTGGRGVPGSSSRAPVSPNTWASEQTKQLDELWQHWQTQQAKAQAAGGISAARVDSTHQQLLDKEQRQELEAAYARASAARSSAKAAAQSAAASRSQRLQAELADLGRMLAEVDTLAAQMEVESGQAAAAVQQFEADLGACGVVC